MVIFSAPSGSGKTTIVQRLLEAGLPLEFSVSATSRKPRGKEVHGKDYYFLSVAEFKKSIDEKAFVEWEEVYHEQYYGTLTSEVHRIWENGKHIVFDVDVLGGLNIKKQFGEKALAVFIQPPSVEVLEQRLRNRGTDDEESLQKRIRKAEYELSFATQFDIQVINDDLENAVEETMIRITEFLNR
jgi:guanylate kinase